MPIAGKLIGLLPVFAPTLAIALPCKASISATRPTYFSQCEHEIDKSEDGIGLLRLLFRSSSGKQHAARGFREHAHSLANISFRDSSYSFDVRRRIIEHRVAQIFKPARSCSDVIAVDEILTEGYPQHAVC